MYFDYPVQVLFRLKEESFQESARLTGGIAYKDEIICGCCGGIAKVEECEEILPLSWANIQEAIAGKEVLE